MSEKTPVGRGPRHPFGEAWLDSCFQQTLLPGAPWHKLEADVAKELSERVKKQFSRPQRKQMLLNILGPNFVDSYFPLEVPQPHILEPPQMSGEERRRLGIEAQSWLLSQAYKCVQDMGYPSVGTGATDGETSSKELSEFLQHTFSLFSNGLDRELYFLDEDLIKEKKDEIQLLRRRQKASRIVVPSVIKSSPGGRSTADKPSTGQIKDKIHRLEGDPPPLWGPQSDRIGKSLVHVLQQDPKRFDTIVGRLHGRQLPASLRSYIWADVLFRSERKRMKGVNVEKLVRERFAKAVQKGIGDLGIKRATNSPITGLIENTVIETYSRTVGMLRHNEDGHLHEASRVLNVLYVYDRSYEPYVVHWLFPLQLALSDNQHLKGENIYELAMYLDLLNTSCFPTWPQVFATAERVMDALQREDPELHKHLRHIAFINIQFDPKEFMVQLMHQEKARAEELLSVSPSAIQADPMSAKLLADPLIFLRKWIGEGFVSVLDTPAILYVWDQCFMQGWRLDVLHNFCLVLLQLLRSRFMEAEDYGQMKEVFLGEPCKLYTMDIQVGWVHLEGGGALADIPPMNRQRPNIPVPGERSVPSTASTHHLQPCGLKYLRLKLVFPPESFTKEPMLSEYSVSDLKLHVSVYFGSVRLDTLHSSHCPLEVSSETDGYGQRTLYVKFAEDKFEFASLDVENLDVERELGGALCAVVEVDYASTEGDRANASTILGWSRVPLYQQVSSNQWNLQPGSNTFPLHPGMDSTSSPFPGTSAHFDTELLGYESELSLVVYELNNEPFEDPGDLIPVQQPPADTREQATPPKPTTEPPSPQRERTPLIVPTPEDLGKKRPKDIIPPPDTPGPDDPSPWVAHRTKAASWNPEPSGPTEAFDIYVDSLRFIPDNASIVKVTGRVVNTGDITAPPDIKALPELSSRARCPVLRYKLTVNEQGESASGDMVVMLRLYTVDMVTEKLTIVGTCFLQVFDTNNEGQHQLRVGGHQLRLHSGMPPLEKAQVIKASDMEAMPPIPGCSILVRLMPHSENFVPVPLYGKGYYQSLACRPSQSEDRVFSSYAQFMAYPADCRQMIKRVQALESVPPMLDDVSLVQWMDGRLDQRRQLPQGTTAGHINILQCVRYRVKQGLMVKVNQAFGLEGNNYVQCLMRVVPGSLAIDMEATEEGYGGKEQWLTLKHDYSSQLRAPQWFDKPQEIHPFYDEHSCVFVQLIGLAVEYRPTKDHSAPGKLTGYQGMHLSRLPDSSLVGWAIIPLFRGNAVLTGEHQVPLFSGRPSAELLGDLTLTSPERVIEKHQLNKSANRMFPGSLSVTIWDSHFDFKDIPVMRTYTSQLASAGNRDLYLKEHKGGAGKTIANLVNDNMKGFEKTGPVFEKEKEFFEQLVTKTYYELVEDALLLAGFGPLKTDHPGLRGLSEPQANIDQSNIAASTPPHQGDSPAAFD